MTTLAHPRRAAVLVLLLVTALVGYSTCACAASVPKSKNSHPGSLDARGAACCNRLKTAGFSSNLPVLVVDTGGKPIDDSSARKKATVNFCTCGASMPGQDYNNTGQIKFRGGVNSSNRNKLRSYNVYLPDQSPFLGLPSEKKFALYQPQNDTLGLRQWLAFTLARDTGEFNPRSTYIETFINMAGGPLDVKRDYVGVQLALQKVIRDKKNVDIPKTTNTTAPSMAGYIMEYEHGQVRNGTVVIQGNKSKQPWNVRYPKEDTITKAQQAYVQQALDQFETALYGPDFANPATGWRKYSQAASFIDWFLEAELLKNAKHSYHGAVYMYKNGSLPLQMGSQWAMSQSFGFCCGYPIVGYKTGGKDPYAPGKAGGAAIAPQGFLFNICDDQKRCISDPTLGLSVWFRQLWTDPAYRTAVAERFLELRAGPWSEASVANRIDAQAAALRPAGLRTIAKYQPMGLLWNPGQYPSDAAGYTASVSNVRTWVLARLVWLESQFTQVANGTIPATLVPQPVDLTIRTRAEGDLAAGPVAVNPMKFQTPTSTP